MAVAVATPSVAPINGAQSAYDTTQKNEIVYGSVAIGASPLTYSTGGIVFNLSNIAPSSSQAPVEVEVWSQPAATAGGTTYSANMYLYRCLIGATPAGCLLQILTGAAAQTALTELSAGSIPAGVSGDVIYFKATFVKNI